MLLIVGTDKVNLKPSIKNLDWDIFRAIASKKFEDNEDKQITSLSLKFLLLLLLMNIIF